MTGVLPVTIEDSRRIVQALLQSGKEYICVMKLHADASESQINKVLKELEDVIYQRPPLRASVKRQLRTRRIYYIDHLETEGRNVLFKVACEGGTYIRKLCFDVGEILGCGAHMQELRRSRSGSLVENESVRLHDVAYWYSEWQRTAEPKFLRKFVQPMESALILVPKIIIRDSAVDAICHGASLTAPGVLSVNSNIERGLMVAIMTLKGEAVALARVMVGSHEILKMNHGVLAQVERVLMSRGTYPKAWKTSEIAK